jgi:hypothetical protein
MQRLLDHPLNFLEPGRLVNVTETARPNRLAKLGPLAVQHLREETLAECPKRRHHVDKRGEWLHRSGQRRPKLVSQRQKMVRQIEAIVVKNGAQLRHLQHHDEHT